MNTHRIFAIIVSLVANAAHVYSVLLNSETLPGQANYTGVSPACYFVIDPSQHECIMFCSAGDSALLAAAIDKTMNISRCTNLTISAFDLHFASNIMPSRWLQCNSTAIFSLDLDLSTVDDIRAFAFQTSCLAILHTLTIRKLNLVRGINPYVFFGLNTLHTLKILSANPASFSSNMLSLIYRRLTYIIVTGSNSEHLLTPYDILGNLEMPNLHLIQFTIPLEGFLSDYAFYGQNNVRILNLSNCGLETIEPNAFLSMYFSLQFLALNRNRLKTLQLSMLNYLIPLIFEIDLTDNELACDCSTAHLRDFMIRYPWIIKFDDCAYPDYGVITDCADDFRTTSTTPNYGHDRVCWDNFYLLHHEILDLKLPLTVSSRHNNDTSSTVQVMLSNDEIFLTIKVVFFALDDDFVTNIQLRSAHWVYTISNVTQTKAYLLCRITPYNYNQTSPLNCVCLFLESNGKTVWIITEMKGVVIGLLVLMVVSLFLIGFGFGYFGFGRSERLTNRTILVTQTSIETICSKCSNEENAERAIPDGEYAASYLDLDIDNDESVITTNPVSSSYEYGHTQPMVSYLDLEMERGEGVGASSPQYCSL